MIPNGNNSGFGKGIIICAPSSGSGKTLLTLGLLRYLRNSGVRVVSGKVGPDYIDAAFHVAASGAQCKNLDPWAMRPSTLSRFVSDLAISSEIVIIEGVMGLFDGVGLPCDPNDGSSAALAAMINLPVVLVIDASGQAESAAVVLKAFANERKSVKIKGVIFNFVGSKRHADILSEAVRHYAPGIKVLGALPKNREMVLPERHLGLVQALEHPSLNAFLDKAASWVGENIDVSSLCNFARTSSKMTSNKAEILLSPLGQHIAVARDAAFSFTYDSILDGWRSAGAEVSFFSPVSDEGPSKNADAIFMPGGYPELHLGVLSSNENFLSGVRRAASRGVVVYGECGGYMVLGEGVVDNNGERYPMLGLLGLEATVEAPKLHLGYRQVSLIKNGVLGEIKKRFRGHEFHFASFFEQRADASLFNVEDANGRNLNKQGLERKNVFGSFIHLIDSVD